MSMAASNGPLRGGQPGADVEEQAEARLSREVPDCPGITGSRTPRNAAWFAQGQPWSI
jgi:hypothetical protein